MTDRFVVYVFSYNRGIFLENCLGSIKESLGDFPVCIIDDNSDDPITVAILSGVSQKFSLIRNANTNSYEVKTGGLAGCMNIAIAHAKNNGYDYAIFIQDDMQFVRPFESYERAEIARYFHVVQNSIQISTSFIRRLSADTFLEDHETNLAAGAYIRDTHREHGKSNFSATGVFNVQRFHDVFKKFEVGEGNNSEKARRLGLTCGRALFPFMCWLPYPLSHRGKRRSLGHRVFEWFGRSGYYPIRMMSDMEIKRFKERDPLILPLMEEFLEAPDAPRKDVWSTGGGEYNFLAYGSIPARVFVALRKVKLVLTRRLFSK